MSRTSIDVDDELVRRAMESSGAKTKTEAVRSRIHELLRLDRAATCGVVELELVVGAINEKKVAPRAWLTRMAPAG